MQPQLQNGTFGIFPRDLCRGLPPAEQLVLTWLWSYRGSTHDDNPNGVWPSIKTMMQNTGYKTEESVRTALHRLEKRGLITIEERKREDGSNCSNNYILFTASPEEDARGYPLKNTTPHPLKNKGGYPLKNTTPLTIQGGTKQMEEFLGETGELGLPGVEQETTRPDVCQQIVDRYNEAAVVGKFPQCRKLTPDIRNKIKARLKEHPSPRDWKPVWASVRDMGFLWETEKPTWFDLGYIIRSEDTFSKVARNFMAWKKKQPGQDHPSNQYFAGEDSAMRRAIAKRTVKVAADGTITMPEENV